MNDMKTRHFIYCLAVIVVLFTACKKDDNSSSVKKEVFSGYAQKGPFIKGSSVTVIELNADLIQTGKTYFTTISDNSGSFGLNNIELASRYVELKADGFYFHEILGQTSNDGQITLYALADIGDVNSANVNVLTHLEKPRVEYLVKQERIDFTAAKQQAQREVLAIFGFESSETPSEELNLTVDAKLLAISCILQGFLSTGDMMELMADVITDIKSDGKLDNMILGSKLMNNAVSIKLSLLEIRNKLTKKYAELGVSVNILDFESYVESFINSEMYPLTVFITYPPIGLYQDNILSDYVTEVNAHILPNYQDYDMTADVPEGQNVKIILKGGFWSASVLNWEKTEYDGINKTQEFITTWKGENHALIEFYDGTLEADGEKYITIEYYENGATTPTKVKKLMLISQD